MTTITFPIHANLLTIVTSSSLFMGYIIIETDDSNARLRQSNDCFVVATQLPA